MLEAMRAAEKCERWPLAPPDTVYGEATVVPHARGRAVPGADVNLRGPRARRAGGLLTSYRPGLGFPDVDLPLRVHCSGPRYTHGRVHRLLAGSCGVDPSPPRTCWVTGTQKEEPTST